MPFIPLGETNMENEELTMSLLVYYSLDTKGLVLNLIKEEAFRPLSLKNLSLRVSERRLQSNPGCWYRDRAHTGHQILQI